jgi:hypothetical protein
MKRLAFALSLLAGPLAAQDRGEWELYLTVAVPEREAVTLFYGVMVSQEACQLAGQGIALLTLQHGGALQIGVTCVLRVSA